MDKIISGIIQALFTELFLLLIIYGWNWLGSNLLPDVVAMFLVFRNVDNFIIETATRNLNLLGIVVACILRGWLYLVGHKMAFEAFADGHYYTTSESYMYHTIIAIISIIGVFVIGFPDKGECFIAAYILSFILAILAFSKK